MARRKIPSKPVVLPDSPDSNSADYIARLVGVSRSTVSRALSGSPVIAESTRKRVMEVAQALGHRPNAFGRALRTGKSHCIGIAIMPWHSEFWARMLMQFFKTIVGHGLDVSIAVWNPDEPQAPWLAKVLLTGRLDVLVAHYELAGTPDCKLPGDTKQPVILLNHVPDNTGSLRRSAIAMDDASGIHQAVRHLAALGHRDIRYIGGGMEYFDAARRLQGFQRAMVGAGLAFGDGNVLNCEHGYSPQSGADAIHSLLSSGAHPATAFVCASDKIALGAIAALAKWGLRVPQDVSITGFDDDPWAQFVSPALTSVHHEGEELGSAAAELAMRHYNDPAAEPQALLLPPKLVIRDSTAPPKAPPA